MLCTTFLFSAEELLCGGKVKGNSLSVQNLSLTEVLFSDRLIERYKICSLSFKTGISKINIDMQQIFCRTTILFALLILLSSIHLAISI